MKLRTYTKPTSYEKYSVLALSPFSANAANCVILPRRSRVVVVGCSVRTALNTPSVPRWSAGRTTSSDGETALQDRQRAGCLSCSPRLVQSVAKSWHAAGAISNFFEPG